MRRIIFLTLIVVLLTGCASLGITGRNSSSANPAPYFELDDLNGETWSSDELKGKVVMLYFWSASCPPCIEKLGDLSILQDQLPEDVALLLVNVGDNEQRIRQLVTNYSNLNVLLNGRGVFARYQIRYTPTTVLIDKDGNIADFRVGLMQNSEALDIINGLN